MTISWQGDPARAREVLMPRLRDDRADAGAPRTRSRVGARAVPARHILFCKYGLHMPLNRQSTTYAREGVELDVSTLADWVVQRRPRRCRSPKRSALTCSRPSASIADDTTV